MRVLLWIKNFFRHHKYKSLATVALIVLASTYYFLHKKDSAEPTEFASSILIELCGAAIVFIIGSFLHKEIIKRLTHHKFEELDEFDEEKYFDEIATSKKQIKILETYIEKILSKKAKFRACLEKFIENSFRHGNIPKIEILLLDPDSENAKQRILQLSNHYKNNNLEYKNIKSDDELVKKFRDKMHSWLEDMSDLQESLITFSRYAFKRDVEIEFKVYDAPAPYSLYSYDNVGFWGFFRGGLPTTMSKQLMIYDLNSDAAEFFLKRFDEISDSVNCTTKTLKQYLIDKKRMPVQSVVSKFQNINSLISVDEIFSSLTELCPNQINEEDLFGLIDYVEGIYSTENFNFRHFNVFGTGGDKTINISSMSAILASHLDEINVIKVGTSAVTSNWGSQQFFTELNKRIRDLDAPPPFLQFRKGSTFLSLESIGHKYSTELIRARKKLHENQQLDIYKLIFPSANFTKSSGQVNGVHKEDYIPYYIKIAKKFNKNMLIVHSIDYKVDELLAGRNKVIHIYNGHVKEEIISIPRKMSSEKYWAFFKESTNIAEHIDKFVKIANKEIDNDILLTISYNVACLLKLQYPQESLTELNKIAFERLKK